MLLSTTEISNKYAAGLKYLANSVYNQVAFDLYGIQYKKTPVDRRLTLLLYALNSWLNLEGAVNIMTIDQLLAVMDRIEKCRLDSMASQSFSSATDECCGSAQSFTLQVLDTNSIDLTYVNGVLSADLRISATNPNRAIVLNDGLYVPDEGNATQIKMVRTADFVDSNIYVNATLVGKTIQMIMYQGQGVLFYNPDNPEDPDNQYKILNTGGFQIIIPGFDVQTGNNYFYIFYS